ncbi:MAG: NUDIX domain-containing protein [Saccharofermentanales bacterium]|jgi:ADP-ribose pyrophosphatase|nr:NUDIX hydrolase [Clostridiaceae bacterium]
MMDLFREDTILTNTVFEGRVFKVEVQSVRLQDGRPAYREIVRHPGGAGILAIDKELYVYLVRQYRKPYDQVLLEIPAGKLEPDEEPLACARRELIEETGLTAEHFEFLATVYPSPGYCSETITIFLATGLKPGWSQPEDGEFLSCDRMPLAEALTLLDLGKIPDAKTRIALLTLARRLVTKQKTETD